MLILSFILYNSRGFSPENQYIIRNKSQYFISKSILSVKGSRIYVLFLHWHTHEVGQPFHISLLLLFLAFHLVGLKCQPAAFGQPQRYSPPPFEKRCLDIVSLQSSVKINQISLDESGDHVGICSEDGKVRFPLVTHPWAYIANLGFSSSIIHMSPSYQPPTLF